MDKFKESGALEIASVIFGVPAEKIKKATFKEPILEDILKKHVVEVREKMNEKILNELFNDLQKHG